MSPTRNRKLAGRETVRAPYSTPAGEILYTRFSAADPAKNRWASYNVGLRLNAEDTDAFEEAAWTLFRSRFPEYDGILGLPVRAHEDGRGRYIKARTNPPPRVIDAYGRALPPTDQHSHGLLVGWFYAYLNAERAGVSFFINTLVAFPEPDAFPHPVSPSFWEA
ncbi:hypothetical protein [Methylobacterium sp. SD21]|uniref:hypothetical protein n=1 Tax=Methylobacterium litchii TaxID=3138810 RepID=UPI00313EA104